MALIRMLLISPRSQECFVLFIDRITKTLLNYRFNSDNIDKMHNNIPSYR